MWGAYVFVWRKIELSTKWQRFEFKFSIWTEENNVMKEKKLAFVTHEEVIGARQFQDRNGHRTFYKELSLKSANALWIYTLEKLAVINIEVLSCSIPSLEIIVILREAGLFLALCLGVTSNHSQGAMWYWGLYKRLSACQTSAQLLSF